MTFTQPPSRLHPTSSSALRARCAIPLLVAVLGLDACGGCGRDSGPPREAPVDELETVLSPAGIAKALRRAGGGQFHAVTTFDIGPTANGQGPRDAVTTNTDIWMDKSGHYRLLETNDRDGGREVIAFGKEIAVALRYGRLVRRPLQEAEATRFLQEGLGGPIAAWEVARRFATVTRKDDKGGRASTIDLAKASEPQSVKADLEQTSPLQKWRDSINVETLSGQVRVDESSMLPMKVKMEARFGLARDGALMAGLVRVDAEFRGVGQISPLEPPNAEELQTRQRTILEERALLGRAGTDSHK